MRVPLNGGPPEMLFKARAWSLISCARAPSELCAIAETSEDRKQLIVTSLDAMKGRGPELMRFPVVPNDNRWFLEVSADGTRIAVIRSPASSIYVFSVHGRPVQEIKVRNWSNLRIFTWAISGKGLFLDEGIRSGQVLLYVDLQGNTHRLWENTGSTDAEARPSPDGRYLAIQSRTTNSNMWMMENF
jgi:hypothetical protein